MPEVLYKDKSYPVEKSESGQAITGLDFIKKLQPSTSVVAMKHGDVIYDLSTEIPEEGPVEFIDVHTKQGLEIVRHSAAHIMAQAVKELYPEAQVTIGPVIENGFFYDFSYEPGFKEEDLKGIEKKMKEIIKKRYPITRAVWTAEKAIEYFSSIGEDYKCEIIRDLGETEVSLYTQGEFTDLCRGTHIPHTGAIPAFKLSHVAGAYWRGDEKNEMLTRIYGTAWDSKEALKEHLHNLEEAKKRDHRKIGTALNLFSFHEEAPASPFFHPAGAFVYGQLQEFIAEVNAASDYENVITPLVLSDDLWKTSGHYENYKENMYFTQVDEKDYALKPMNCPGHSLIYKNTKHSYKELPIRYAEFGRVHRHERSGAVAGLFRVRSFVQDDAHIFCTNEQIESEIGNVLKIIDFVYRSLGFEYNVELSTRPEKRIGGEEVWDLAEQALKNSLESSKLEYVLNEGDGAFYGPKIDFHLKDSIGRTHQCGTVQLDFSMPERFGLSYAGSDNTDHTPVMIHRAVIGSFERFLGVYIEHVAGIFPLWMAPKQAAILTISDGARAYATEMAADMKSKGYRVILDDSNEKLGYKVRKYQALKLPYMIVIGEKEAENKVLSIRNLSGEQRHDVSLVDLYEEWNKQNRPHFND